MTQWRIVAVVVMALSGTTAACAGTDGTEVGLADPQNGVRTQGEPIQLECADPQGDGCSEPPSDPPSNGETDLNSGNACMAKTTCLRQNLGSCCEYESTTCVYVPWLNRVVAQSVTTNSCPALRASLSRF